MSKLFFVQKLAWLVVAIVMVINSYVLLDFYKNMIKGLLSKLIFCRISAAYMAFIIYLIVREGFGSHYMSLLRKRFSKTQIVTTTSQLQEL